MVKNIPDGVYPTMVTPFTEDNKVDYNGVLELLIGTPKRALTAFLPSASQARYFSFRLRRDLSCSNS